MLDGASQGSSRGASAIDGESSVKGAEDSAPRNWSLRETGSGREIRCARRSGEGRFAAWLFILALVAACGYGAAVFALGWATGEEVLVGGVVLFLLLLAGLLAGLYLISAMFRTTTYVLRAESMSITTAQPVVGESTDDVQRSAIREVVRLYGPPERRSRRDIWRTLLMVCDWNGQETGTIALEGETEGESAWLAPLIAKWAQVPVRIERNDSD